MGYHRPEARFRAIVKSGATTTSEHELANIDQAVPARSIALIPKNMPSAGTNVPEVRNPGLFIGIVVLGGPVHRISDQLIEENAVDVFRVIKKFSRNHLIESNGGI